MELYDYIANRLGITNTKEVQCIKNILDNTIVLNEYKSGKLSEEKLDMLVKVTGAYLNEILEVINSPDKYKQKLDDLNQQLKEVL